MRSFGFFFKCEGNNEIKYKKNVISEAKKLMKRLQRMSKT